MAPNAYIDNALAAELDGKLWEWARKRAARDRDLSAALDIMRHFATNNLMPQAQADAAQNILKVQEAPPAPAPPPPSAPKPKGDPGDVLERLSNAGMLRGRNGQKAMSLLEQRGRWSAAQSSFAASLANDIERSAIIYVAVKEIAEEQSGNRFAENLVESFDEWGSYTPKQQDAACGMVEKETGSDPLKAAFAKSNPDQTSIFSDSAGLGGPRIAPPPRAPQAPPPVHQQSGPRDDDDIPF